MSQSDENATRGAVDALTRLLDLETLDDNLFRSLTQEEGWKRVYGGQVLGQALMAAQRTVEPGRLVHSLHGYFILPGDPQAPILYQVERARDGKSFNTRRVVAIQHGRPIFNLGASFQIAEEGLEHQDAMPDVPGPDALESDLEVLRRHIELLPERSRAFWLRPRPVEFRSVQDPLVLFGGQKQAPVRQAWFRVAAPLPADTALHRAMLAYISDTLLVATATMPHGVTWTDRRFQVASLDHAMWFHDDVRTDDWLLYDLSSGRASGARGLALGKIFSRDGRLVATVMQEGLIRLHKEPSPA